MAVNETAKERALRRLRAGDRTAAEMAAYLRDAGVSDAETAETLRYLSDAGYVNDARYCENAVEKAAAKGHARRRITEALIAKGIAPELAARKVSEGVDAEEERRRGAALFRAAVSADGTADANGTANANGRRARAAAARLARLGYDETLIESLLERGMS